MSDLFRNVAFRMVVEDIAFLLVRKIDQAIAPWTARSEVDPRALKYCPGMYVKELH
jgi:hypothetical protein